jgi:PTH1 family peptidyl-tRNA hydrolase
MQYVIVGLGNPGEEYEGSRHNAGRTLVERFAARGDFPEWKNDKKARAHVTKGELAGNGVTLVLPDTFMNRSGSAVLSFVKSVKAAERLVVVYDDIDLPIGTMKISFGRGSGGHRGVESVARSLKTKDFVRVRVGVAPTTPSGKVKKPRGEKEVVNFLMKPFRKPEQEKLKKLEKQVLGALDAIIEKGRAVAMNEFN